jgi:heat-inducible transcriptional repressor
MQTDAALSTRAEEILHSIVQEYIETGEPVGSRTIAKRRTHSLSPASIRNVMADLTEEGYLSQPHTSAGRMPTDKAFRIYVKSLTASRLPSAEYQRLRTELNEATTVEQQVERCSHLLSEMTRNVGIAVAVPGSGQELEHIELIPLADRRVLTILVTRDRMVRNRVVTMDEPVSAAELENIRNYVNRSFKGWQLGDVRRELVRRVAEERALFDAVLQKLNLLYQKGLLATDAAPEVHMEGASNLVGLDLHLTRERMRELLRALEEKQRLIALLDQFLEAYSGGLAVHVGLGEAHPAMRELALIGIALPMHSGLTAKIAVLGPMRMNYERVMSAVLYLGRTLEGVSF